MSCDRRCAPNRRGTRWLAWGTASLFLLFGPSASRATELPARIVRVEEDWVLVLLNPDATTTAPQITALISPQADLEGIYATLEINHGTQPEFSAGGVHLHAWDGSDLLDSAHQHSGEELLLDGETITWTQAMFLEGDRLHFGITAGTSDTWSELGDAGQLQVSVPTELDDLNGYRLDVTVGNSGVGFAANRVHRLRLDRVRLFTAQGVVLEYNAEQLLHAQD